MLAKCFSNTGKRDAVRTNAGLPVGLSGPGLRVGPGTPITSGRNPEACPPDLGVGVGAGAAVGVGVGVAIQVEFDFGAGGLSQEKRGRESESSALGGASDASDVLRNAATQRGSYLDKRQINSNSKTYEDVLTRAPFGRGKHCGKVTVSCVLPDGSRRYIRVDCRCWAAPTAAQRRPTDTGMRFGTQPSAIS